MAASADPTKFDPKLLKKILLTTSLVTMVTGAAAERGTKIERIIICNITTSGTPADVTVTIEHQDAASAFPFRIMDAAVIPPNGYPVVLELGIYLMAGELLQAKAGAAASIHLLAYGIEMA